MSNIATLIDLDKENFPYAAGCVILLVWTVSAVFGMLTHDYQGLQLVTPIMAVLAGWIFGIDLVKKNRQDRRDKDWSPLP